MEVIVKSVKVEWNGEIKGVDCVLSTAMKACGNNATSKEAKNIAECIGSLSKELVGLSHICKSYAEANTYMGYVVDVHIKDRGVVWEISKATTPSPSIPLRLVAITPSMQSICVGGGGVRFDNLITLTHHTLSGVRVPDRRCFDVCDFTNDHKRILVNVDKCSISL